MAETEDSGKVVTSVLKRAVRNIRKKPHKEFITLGKPKERSARIPEAKRSQELEKALKKGIKSGLKPQRGIVYLSHIPPGFYEKQILKFFNQFGSVTRVKLVRSEKTGKTRGHAYIEFSYMEVAKIVAETMNNYLMGNRLLKAELLEKRFPTTFWKQIDPKNCPGKLRSKAHTRHLNERFFDNEQLKKFVKEKQSKLKKFCDKMKKRGIDFSFEPECADIDTDISGEGNYRALDESESSIKSGGLVLEVDESDDEIEFNPPPNVIKKRLVSTGSGKKEQKLSTKKPLSSKKGKVVKVNKKATVVGLKKNLSGVVGGNVLRRKKNTNRYFDKPLDTEAASSNKTNIPQKTKKSK